MAKDKHKAINLALQGGGSHGALSWGVIDRLLEDGRLTISGISGASAGAVNAVALAYGLHLGGAAGARQKLDEVWEAICRAGAIFSPVRRTPFDIFTNNYDNGNSFSYQAFDAFTRTFSPYEFNPFDINPLRDILERTIDFDALNAADCVKLFISATNVRTGKGHVFEIGEITLKTVLASGCLPFLFKAVEIDGEHYWDGGYMGNPVLYPFFYAPVPNDIVIVHVNPIERDTLPVTAPEIMNRLNEITFNSTLLRELRAISFVQRLLDEKWLKKEHRDRLRMIRIHSIRSDKAAEDLPSSSKFDTDWKYLSTLKERGRQFADDWLAENFDDIGERSTVDLRALYE